MAAVKKLAQEAGVPEDVAKLWLMKQAIWQIELLCWRCFQIFLPCGKKFSRHMRIKAFFSGYEQRKPSWSSIQFNPQFFKSMSDPSFFDILFYLLLEGFNINLLAFRCCTSNPVFHSLMLFSLSQYQVKFHLRD